MPKKQALNWLKDLAPALAVLLFSIIFSIFYGAFAPLTKWQTTAWNVPLRFFRFTGLLCIPLFALPKVYSSIVKHMTGSLLLLERKEELKIGIFKHWFFRPAQGIGIGLIFGTKLIMILQIISEPSAGGTLLISEGHFQYGRLITVALITIAVSLLLSTLWTFDDMGIRYFNKKDQELKMIGKYIGTVIPFVFGVYGIFTLIANYPIAEAFLLVFKIIVVLYPPLSVFTVLHTYFIRNRTGLFLRHDLRKGGIFSDT